MENISEATILECKLKGDKPMEKLSETTILEFKYKSEDERLTHIEEMKKDGFRCHGQVMQTDDPFYEKNPTYYYYGKFIKTVK